MAILIDERFRSYADRIKIDDLPKTQELEFAKSRMISILLTKNVPPARALAAVQDALAAAANHQLASLQFDIRQSAAGGSTRALKELISILAALYQAVSVLPAKSKGILNANLAEARKDSFFDTETFHSLITTILSSVLYLSPQVAAQKVARLIEINSEYGEETPRCSRLWEQIPAITRVAVEQQVQEKPHLSGTELLRLLPVLLKNQQPAPLLGRTPSLQLCFVKVVDQIWRRLSIKGRRRYDVANDKHLVSLFQEFCNFALLGVGDHSSISIRQVANLRRQQRTKRIIAKALKNRS